MSLAENFNRAHYTSIPEKLWEYYDRIVGACPSHRLLEAIRKQGSDVTWRAINEIFDRASQATKISPDQLIGRLGFETNDLDPANFQAMLGILRAINLLNQIGFRDIEPLRPKLNRQEADLLAQRGNKRYAIEVFRSSEAAYRFIDHEKPSANLVTYIAERTHAKLQQVVSTVQAHNCDAGIIVIVVDSQPAKALSSTSELQDVMSEAFQAIGSPTGIHLFLFTGMANEQGSDEYVCCPSLPEVG